MCVPPPAQSHGFGVGAGMVQQGGQVLEVQVWDGTAISEVVIAL